MDPNNLPQRPTKPLSPLFRFKQHHYATTSDPVEDNSPSKANEAITRMFEALPEDQREALEKQYQDEMRQFEKALKEYEDMFGKASPVKGKKKVHTSSDSEIECYSFKKGATSSNIRANRSIEVTDSSKEGEKSLGVISGDVKEDIGEDHSVLSMVVAQDADQREGEDGQRSDEVVEEVSRPPKKKNNTMICVNLADSDDGEVEVVGESSGKKRKEDEKVVEAAKEFVADAMSIKKESVNEKNGENKEDEENKEDKDGDQVNN